MLVAVPAPARLRRRASRTARRVTTNFLYDGADVVRDSASDNTTVEYINGPGIDDKLRQSSAGTGALYFLQDHLGSTRALTNAGGGVVEQSQYEAFGASAGSSLTRYGFTGRERESLTGLLYFRARWYDPQQGRFVSEDPIGFEGGANFYSYVNNYPVGAIDPIGLQGWHAGGRTGAPQNPVADRRCPPTVDQILANKKIRAELNVAFSVSGHRTDHPLEHGGWVYQTRRGALQFVRAGDERAASGRIDLRNPPTLRGAIVVADYHTHPYTESDATNSLREGFNNMRPSRQDEDVAFKVGVPDIVVYESGFQNGASQLTAWGVGPNRRGGAPDRAGGPADGFPGNSVDNRGCR